MKDKFIIGFCGVMLVAGFALVLAQFFAPCSWLGWMSVVDIPSRCLP